MEEEGDDERKEKWRKNQKGKENEIGEKIQEKMKGDVKKSLMKLVRKNEKEME